MKTKEWLARRPQHIVARIVCLFLAVITWLCVMRTTDPVCDGTLNSVPITVMEAEGIEYSGLPDSSTIHRVRIRATKAVLAVTQSSDIRAYVNMADLLSHASLVEDATYEMKVYFQTPEGVMIDGDYTVNLRLKAKA